MSWNKIPDKLPPQGQPILAYRKSWVNPDFEPTGVREAYMQMEYDTVDDGPYHAVFYSAMWDPEQDEWAVSTETPTHWMEKPDGPEA